MESNKTIESLLNIIAELTNQVSNLEERMVKLEKVYNTDSVYLDGAPEYVKAYVKKGGAING